MGVISGVIAAHEDRHESDLLEADDAGDASPDLSRELTDAIDPFIMRFDLSHFEISDRDLQLILGLLIVISNLFGD